MAFAGLLAIDGAGADGAWNPAFAGSTLVEQQLRRLHAAGAAPLFLLLDGPGADASAVLAELRRDRIAVVMARRLGEVVERLAATPRVLLLGGGCLPDAPTVAGLAAAAPATIATVADTRVDDAYERIDAAARWAGLALIDGPRIAAAAAMIGEWAPGSTLLRRAVQEGAARIAVEPPPNAAAPAGLRAAEAALLAGDAPVAPTMPAERLDARLARGLLDLLLARGGRPRGIAAAGLAAATAALPLAIAGWRIAALTALLAATPMTDAARRLATIQQRPAPNRIVHVAPAAAAAACALILGRASMRDTGQWGWLLVAALLVAATAGAAEASPRAWWRASARSGPWLLVPFALAGRCDAGLAALALHATASLAAAFGDAREAVRWKDRDGMIAPEGETP